MSTGECVSLQQQLVGTSLQYPDVIIHVSKCESWTFGGAVDNFRHAVDWCTVQGIPSQIELASGHRWPAINKQYGK